jgi:hypothetical protein
MTILALELQPVRKIDKIVQIIGKNFRPPVI